MGRRVLWGEPTWVYRCFSTERHLLYVGIAHDVPRRMAQHAATKSWWDKVDHIFTEQYATRRKALTVESWFITHHNPRYNVAGMPDDSVAEGGLRTQLLYPGPGPGGFVIETDLLAGEV